MIRSMLLGAMAAALVATSAAAQERSHVLPDGRTVVLAPAAAPCDSREDLDAEDFVIVVGFYCADPISGAEGEGWFGVGGGPGKTTPAEYLASLAEAYWPTASAEERAEQVFSAKVTGRASPDLELTCLPITNEDATASEVTCVLVQPFTQVIVHGRAANIEHAMGTILMFATGVTIR